MITGSRRVFSSKMARRGYTLDEVRACIVSEDGDTITVDETHPAYPRHPKPGVSLLTKATNFAKSAAAHVAAGMPQASDEEILRRHAICTGCEFFVNDSCGKCGCPVARDRKFVSKLAWADQSCPVGKWGPASA
jgi:hypothetical protein